MLQTWVHQKALQVVSLLPEDSTGLLRQHTKRQRAVQRAVLRWAARSLIWGSPRHLKPLSSKACPSSAPVSAPHQSHHTGVAVPSPSPLGPNLTLLTSLASFSDMDGHTKLVWGCLHSQVDPDYPPWIFSALLVWAQQDCAYDSEGGHCPVSLGWPSAPSSLLSVEEPTLAPSWWDQPAMWAFLFFFLKMHVDLLRYRGDILQTQL